MPCDYQTELKAKFPLPEYPQENQFDNSVRYKRAVKQFGADHPCVFAECEQWVDCEAVTDIACASKAA